MNTDIMALELNALLYAWLWDFGVSNNVFTSCQSTHIKVGFHDLMFYILLVLDIARSNSHVLNTRQPMGLQATIIEIGLSCFWHRESLDIVSDAWSRLTNLGGHLEVSQTLPPLWILHFKHPTLFMFLSVNMSGYIPYVW